MKVLLAATYHSDLDSLKQILRPLGITLNQKESDTIVETAMKKATSVEMRERMDSLRNALLEYVNLHPVAFPPARAAVLYNQVQGAKCWEALKLDNTIITFSEREMTVKEALDKCAAAPASLKTAMFTSIVCGMAEKYRIRSEETNSFGITYDEKSSDPDKMTADKTFNCFSASITLGQMVAYAAVKAGLQDTIKPMVELVASYTTNGVRWNDRGHAILRLEFLDAKGGAAKTMFFDPMNELVPRQETAFSYNAAKNIIEPADEFGRIAYRLVAPLAITQNLVNTAKFQDKVFAMKNDIDDKTAAQIAKMPPLFTAYLAFHLSDEQQQAFFTNYSLDAIKAIAQPAIRFRIAAMAAEALTGVNEAKALSCGTLALSSLSEAWSKPKDRTQLPTGGFLKTTVNLISLMEKTEQGESLIAHSSMTTYLPYVAHTATFEDPAMVGTAAKARDFLVTFYESHTETFATLGWRQPLLGVLYCQGLTSLNDWAGSSQASEKALNGIYDAMGFKRQEILKSLKENVGMAAGDLSVSQADAEFFKTARGEYVLERNFLFVAERFFNGTFSLKFLRNELAGVRGPDAVTASAVYPIFSKSAELAKIMQENGPFAAAVDQARDEGRFRL